jgi:hypothetical protein
MHFDSKSLMQDANITMIQFHLEFEVDGREGIGLTILKNENKLHTPKNVLKCEIHRIFKVNASPNHNMRCCMSINNTLVCKAHQSYSLLQHEFW